MPKTTKAAQKAVNKYIANNYDRVNLTMPKGKKEDYKEGAEAAGKSLNQYIMDCVEEDVEAEKGRVLYTTEMVELMGEVYKGILRVMNPEVEPAAVIAPAIVKLNRAQRGVNAHADTNAVFNKAKVKIVFKTFIPGITVIGKEYALYFFDNREAVFQRSL